MFELSGEFIHIHAPLNGIWGFTSLHDVHDLTCRDEGPYMSTVTQ